MVFFTCDSCNETLKKNKVEQHMQRCRQCFSVSCIDCSVTFEGRSYVKHTSCISEAEKYQGTLYKPKKGNKKMKPQEIWMNAVSAVTSESVPENIRHVVSALANFENIPRKKKKFVNYLKNSHRHIRQDMIEQVWTLISNKYEMMNPKEVQVPKKKKKVELSDSDSSEWEDSESDDDENDKVQPTTTSKTNSTTVKRKASDVISKKMIDSKKSRVLYFMLVLNRAKRRRLRRSSC